MKVIILSPICPLMGEPDTSAVRVDEALLGMEADCLEERDGWCRLRTHYGYEGWAEGARLLTEERAARCWKGLSKAVVSRAVCDLLAAPDIKSGVLLSLVRGCILAPTGESSPEGWQGVFLPDGQTGYIKQGFLGGHCAAPPFIEEGAMRQRLTRAAHTYLGSPYRWGGKTPLGIDCSGLVSMAYLLNGIIIWRDAAIKEGYPVHPIPLREAGCGDLLYFPGHIAMYLGEGRYIHATAREGSDGVVVNSLDPRSPLYRADLAEGITAVGSIF